jgi:hypothetical protein
MVTLPEVAGLPVMQRIRQALLDVSRHACDD